MSFDVLIVGQGLAGTALAWHLLWRGARVCVLDREAAVTSSRVAAGLVTPITGRRLAKSWRLDDLWPAAVAFYGRVETETAVRFFHRRTTIRLFRDASERARFEGRRASFGDWVGGTDPPVNPDWFAAPHGGFAMPTAAQLATESYLDASRAAFARRGAYLAADIDPTRDLAVSVEGVSLPQLGLRADQVVFCQGHDAAVNPWFRGVRFGGAKGELLTLRIPGLTEERVVNRGVWLLPLGGGLFRAGATYDHDALDCVPTARGREEICGRLREFLRLPFEVIDHRAAVRPVIDAGRPALGLHPENDRVGFFNGLGSKGALLAPFFADQLAAILLGKS